MTTNGDSYNRAGFIAFIFSMVFSLMFFVYIGLMHPGVDLKEVAEVEKSTEAVAEGEAEGGQPKEPSFDPSQVKEPWVTSPEMVAYGQGVYKANCAVCHGDKGLGDGPAGKALVPPPRNLVEGKWTQGGDSIALFKTVQNGISGTSMASFGHLPKVDRWALVHFIRSITKKPVKDDAKKLEAFASTAK